MARKKIKRIIQSPESYGDAEKQFPTVSIRPNATNKIHNVKQNIQRRNFEKGRSRAQRINRNPQEQVNAPIKFMQDIPKVKTDVCFVVGGGPSLNGFDFSELNEHLMILKSPQVFCVGEMLDWEAPTGGYLINACLATGYWVGKNA